MEEEKKKKKNHTKSGLAKLGFAIATIALTIAGIKKGGDNQ